MAPGGIVEIVGHGGGDVTPDYRDTVIAAELADTAEIDDRYRRLAAAGLPMGEPEHHHWGHYSLSVRDPANVEIVLYSEVHAPAPAASATM